MQPLFLLVELFLALVAVFLAGSVHFLLLRRIAATLKERRSGAYLSFIALLIGGTLGQCVAAFLFALAYVFSSALGLGYLEAKEPLNLLEIFSFSLVNITTLGLGDVIPDGALKLMAGIEAMTGFLLISCTASHVFQAMKLD